MLKNHISERIISELGYQPTGDQYKLIIGLSDIVVKPDNKKVCVIKGYAGTGKTSTISALVKVLDSFKIKNFLMAPTGRAAKVFTSFSGKKAFTIHKKIYRQRSSKDGFGSFALDKNLHKNTFFIVDEASMISNESNDISVFGSGSLLDDLIEYVDSGENCMLILIGDSAQLPPVGLSISPALERKKILLYNKEVAEFILTEVVRQANDSGILFNATQIRKNIEEDFPAIPHFKFVGFNDVAIISGQELINELNESYQKFGLENTIVICRSNKLANRYNFGIRNQILQYENEITTGDYLMVVKNNYYWIETLGDEKIEIPFIANGDIVRIKRIKKYEDLYGFRFANVTIELPDYDNFEMDVKILLDTLSSETASLSGEENKKLFYTILEDYTALKPKRKQYQQVKENPYFNALQVKFAYAVTCHKSQGGQWPCVFVDHGWLGDDFLNIDFLRWLYTAFTRPVEKIFLVNFRKELIP